MQKVNFDVIRWLVYLHAKCNVTGQVTVDIPLKITRNTRTKNIETKQISLLRNNFVREPVSDNVSPSHVCIE